MVVKSKEGKEYTYDTNRSAYMRKYYKDNVKAIRANAVKRYRVKVTAKFYTDEKS